MKFGKQLQGGIYKPWQQHYMSYNKLKRLLYRYQFQATQRHRGEQRQEEEEIAAQTGQAVEGTPLLWGLLRQRSKSPVRDRGGNTFPPDSPEAGEVEQGLLVQVGTAGVEAGGGVTDGKGGALSPAGEKRYAIARQVSLEEKSAHEVEFFQLVDEQMLMVEEFYRGKLAELDMQLKDFENKANLQHTWSVPSGNTYRKLKQLYTEILCLKAYSHMNSEGFRKIVKKFDKGMGTEFSKGYKAKLAGFPFHQAVEVEQLEVRARALVSRDKLLELQRHAESLHSGEHSDNVIFESLRPAALFVSLALFLAAWFFPPLPVSDPHASRCFALLLLVTSMWVTEAIPYFATALLIPVLVVLLDVMEDKSGRTLERKDAASLVLGHLVNHTTILIMGGYSISAAFSRCEIELRIASVLQGVFGQRPRLFILSIMYLGLGLSMLISNHTAPVLCVSILLPIVRDCASDSRFAKSLLLGLAFACNFGGMITPISSMQNVVAAQALENSGSPIGFGTWIGFAAPFCIVGVFAAWCVLMVVVNPQDVKHIPVIVYTKDKIFTRKNNVILLLTFATIAAWSTISMTQGVLGDLGIIALMFMVIMFGSGMLSEVDFNSFSWHTLFLLGGGNVLGEAIASSHLLNFIATSILEVLPSDCEWLLILEVVLVTMFISTFVSHTVAAIILMPIIIKVGAHLGIPVTLGMCAALAVSAGCALPFSSFPNVTSLLVVDDYGSTYLRVADFLKSGLPMSVVGTGLIVTLGYALISIIVLPATKHAPEGLHATNGTSFNIHF